VEEVEGRSEEDETIGPNFYSNFVIFGYSICFIKSLENAVQTHIIEIRFRPVDIRF